MKLAYIDMVCGAAGDMLLGACVDAGVDLKELERGLRGLNLPGWTLRRRAVMKGALGATKVDVVVGGRTEFEVMEEERHGHDHGHGHHSHEHPRSSRLHGWTPLRGHERSHVAPPDRKAPKPAPARHSHGMSLQQILDLLKRAKLPASVKERATEAFLTLGKAEARVHRKTLKTVHFHEVGAIDSIVDMTGGVLALEMLGVDKVAASPFPMTRGVIHCAHGSLPVPGPATMEIVRGAPTEPLDVEGEILTPTGAALVRTLAESFGPMPAMTVETVAYGAGDRDFGGRPNVLRLVLGEQASGGNSDAVWVMETNLDNASPEIIAYAMDKCFEAGAVDVFATAIQMKKGRPATLVTALVPPAALAAVEAVLFRETRTLGVRRHLVQRNRLDRASVAVRTRFGPIRVKTGSRGREQIAASPEFEDCRKAAEKSKTPLHIVYAEALAAFRAERKAR